MTNETEAEPTRMVRVIIESPYYGDTPDQTDHNIKYGRSCLRDCLERGEAPFAGHLLYTQVLDDNNNEERVTGIQAGIAWTQAADLVVVYTDLGLSSGMKYGIEQASKLGIQVEFRELADWSEVQ